MTAVSVSAEAVARALGGRRSGRGWVARCPAHRDRTPSLSIGEAADGRLLLHCFAGCSFESVRRALPDGSGLQSPTDPRCADASSPGERENRLRRRRIARRIWSEAAPFSQSLVERYLASRAITPRALIDVRFAPRLWHPSGVAAPAMVAAIRDHAGSIIGVHRTWLRADGDGKAPLEPAKAMLGGARGGSVLLLDGDGPLFIAEGVETTLSLADAMPNPRACAALSAGGLATLPLSGPVGELVIGGDGDEAGRRAARRLADRAVTAGWTVRLLIAPDGLDWNDVARAAAKEARDARDLSDNPPDPRGSDVG